MSAEIAIDLGRKITAQIEQVLEREMAIAQRVLPHDDVAFLMLKIASSIAVTAVLVPLQMRKTDAIPAEMFDKMLALIVEMAAHSKERALARLEMLTADGQR